MDQFKQPTSQTKTRDKQQRKLLKKEEQEIIELKDNIQQSIIKAENPLINRQLSIKAQTTQETKEQRIKEGQFSKHTPNKIIQHIGTTLVDAQFVVEWKNEKCTKLGNSRASFQLLLKKCPTLLLDYLEKHIQLD